jgi:hypothetical protein
MMGRGEKYITPGTPSAVRHIHIWIKHSLGGFGSKEARVDSQTELGEVDSGVRIPNYAKRLVNEEL